MEQISVIAAVHHPLRRRIFDHLLVHGPCQVGAIARALDVQVGSISHHLRMLQRSEVVEHVDDPSGDRRTSWWRLRRRSFTWAETDFASPADRLLAREAQRANIRHQIDLLQRWNRISRDSEVEAFSTDSLKRATPAELADLGARLNALLDDWGAGIDEDDGQDRIPVFFFAHGFPADV
ncbi:helix-turn-helix domain-containing protein [Microbacterium sp.]|uniref:helix-turn-helix domain-containing protein n=1 Tax=Microbacterium sp. TaxID=51671 RepID=UPI003341D893